MDTRRPLLRHGLLLFVLGLVTGLAISVMTNRAPRSPVTWKEGSREGTGVKGQDLL